MRRQNSKDTVFVTGADGFVGSYIVKELLSQDFIVRAGVTDKDNDFETRHLTSLPGAGPDTLKLFNFDLMNASCFREPIQGARYVIHVASPTKFDHIVNPEREILAPAREGTLHLLQECENSNSVEKVVFTSCLTTSTYKYREPGKAFDVNEEMWSEENYMQDKRKWYSLGKTLSEKICWQFMEKGDRRFTLVSISPGMIFGPILSPTLPYSNSLIMGLASGAIQEIPLKNYPIVDVRDVASAHVRALRAEHAKGRFFCVGDIVSSTRLVDTISKFYSKAKVPSIAPELRPPYGIVNSVNTTRTTTVLGIKFTPFENTIRDTVQSFVEHGLL